MKPISRTNFCTDTEKINFVEPQFRSCILKNVVSSALEPTTVTDVFVALAGDDVDQADIASGNLLFFLDIFDDSEMSPESTARLNAVVEHRLLKTGTDEQKASAKDLFSKTLVISESKSDKRLF